MGLPRGPLPEGEELVLVLRPHVRRLAVPALLLLLVALLTGLAVGWAPDGGAQGRVRLVVAVLAAAALARWVVRPFLVWFHTVYALTTQRIMAYRGVVRRTGHEVALASIVDVQVEQGLLERALGSGSLLVSSGGGVELALRDVPAVVAVQRTLQQLGDQLAHPPSDLPDPHGGPDPYDVPDDAHQHDDLRQHGDSHRHGDADDHPEPDGYPPTGAALSRGAGRRDGDGRYVSYADELLDEADRRDVDADAGFPRPLPPRRRWFRRR